MEENLKIENAITKSFVFNTRNSIDGVNMEDTIKEYTDYYNKISEFINENLTDLTIGDIANAVNDNKGQTYITMALSDEWKDKPMYYLFGKYHSDNANNLLYLYITKNNIDEYKGNLLNLSETYYRRFGYFNMVVSNYRTKIRELKVKIKKQKIDETSDIETLEKQTIYESVKHKLDTKKAWVNFEEYLNSTEDVNLEYKKRFELLKNYFIEHEEEIVAKKTSLSIENLKNSNGCKMKGNGAMTIKIQNYTIENKENSLGFILNLPLNGKVYKIDLWGNKQIKYGTKDDYKVLVDLINNKGQNINFKFKKKKLFVTFSCEVNFEKKESNFSKVVGIDVNIKHDLMVTSEKDENIKEYINLRKYVLNKKEFSSLLSKDELEKWKKMSENVTFCPLEYDFLFSRYTSDSNSEKEKVFSNILHELQLKLKEEGKIKEYIYVCSVNKLRAKYVSYFKLKQVYSQKQKEYDIQMGFCDDSTESKETMDKRRMEFPFRNTDIAEELYVKMNNISQDIEGCRKNIVYYAYHVFTQNNFDTMAFENLDNSNFEKTQVLPTINSLLKYHKTSGKTIEEAKQNEKICNLIENEYYDFILNDNNEIIDAIYSQKGLYRLNKSLFINQAIKTLHFASIKNDAILLSNNGKIAIALVPSEYTSQMDSQKHVIYCVKNDKDKLVKASKNRVRKNQETYINGLNADFNAANNIKYIIENPEWRSIFCITPKNYKKQFGYNLPQLEPTKKGVDKILLELKKLGACEELKIEK